MQFQKWLWLHHSLMISKYFYTNFFIVPKVYCGFLRFFDLGVGFAQCLRFFLLHLVFLNFNGKVSRWKSPFFFLHYFRLLSLSAPAVWNESEPINFRRYAFVNNRFHLSLKNFSFFEDKFLLPSNDRIFFQTEISFSFTPNVASIYTSAQQNLLRLWSIPFNRF